MAKLGKGILGNPSGVIGNLQTYSRLGKGIIQSRSFPVNAYARRWNLLKSAITKRALFYFGTMTAGQQAQWNIEIIGNETAQDAYLRISLARAYSLKSDRANGINFNNLVQRLTLDAFTVGKWNQFYVNITIPESNSFWAYSGAISVSFDSYNGSVFLRRSLGSYGDVPFQSFLLNLSSDTFVNTTHFRVTFARVGHSNLTNGFTCDIFNPSYNY